MIIAYLAADCDSWTTNGKRSRPRRVSSDYMMNQYITYKSRKAHDRDHSSRHMPHDAESSRGAEVCRRLNA